MKLKKVISGGQSGADEAGLGAAYEAGLETGGWMPPGFLTEFGEVPELAKKYGVKEYKAKGYRARTRANVRDSDGTLIIAGKLNSPGERCTLRAAGDYKKPFLVIDIDQPECKQSWDKPRAEIAKWLIENDIEVLNVAGNRETSYAGMYSLAKDLLRLVFKDLESKNGNVAQSG